MPDTYPFSSTQIAETLSTLQHSSSKKIDNGFLMLCANYEADDMEISTSRLGKAAGYDNYNTANEQYGSFAHKICDELGYTPKLRDNGKPIWTSVLCEDSSERDSQNHFQWRLRPQVAVALEDLGMVRRIARTDLLDEIKAKDETLTGYSEKDRETIIKARIGQGEFRKRLIRFWGGCSVTGCDSLELLVASHIKPWRDCVGKEAIDQMNGLLLLPNLDKAFDRGLISFDDKGRILLSKGLPADLNTALGINKEMKLSKIMSYHLPYLQHHREHVFQAEMR